MPRRNRRMPVPALAAIATSALSDVTAEYTVTVSNGSGVQHLTMYGTQTSVWCWAQEAGRRGGFGAGNWQPKDIVIAANVVSQSPFLAIA